MTEENTTLVSYNRPLTRQARRALTEYGIVSEDHIGEMNRWTEVVVNERPPKDILEKHELSVDEDPVVVYSTGNGERIEVFDDRVLLDGREVGTSPKEAHETAMRRDWTVEDGEQPL